MIQVVELNDKLRDQYKSYLAGRRDARFGHDLEWAQVLRDTYGVESEHLVALEDEKIVGICPLFLCKPIVGGAHYQTSLFPSNFGPLYDSDQVLDAILKAIREKTSSLQYAEILAPMSLPETTPEHLPFSENLDYTFRLSLQGGADKVFDGFCRDYKRILRKPINPQEMELTVDAEGKLIDEFYKLYVDIYARKHGFIPHTRRLFKNIFAFYPKGIAKIYLAKIKGEYVGGMFTLWAHHEAYYAWSAVQPNSTYHPTHFLLWQIIQDAAAQRYDWFNMGESPRHHEGLNRFKREWGTEVLEPVRYFIPGKMPSPNIRLYDRVSWTKKIITHLPAAVITNFLSPAIRFFL